MTKKTTILTLLFLGWLFNPCIICAQTIPEQLHLAEIFIKVQADAADGNSAAESKARNILLRIAKGERFEDLAVHQSDGPTAKDGGDIGYLGLNEFSGVFKTAVASLNAGE